MESHRLPSVRVCSFVSKFLDEWTADERQDFFALVAQANTHKLSFSREQIEQAIAREGNIARAADALGCSRRTLQLHMRKLGMPGKLGGRPPRVVLSRAR